MKKLSARIGLLLCLSIITVSITNAAAYEDNICSGSVISYKGTYYQQDQIYPSGLTQTYTVSLKTITFNTDGKIYGIYNDNGEENENVELTNQTVPEDWLMPDPDNTDQPILNYEFLFLSNPDILVDIKQDLQSFASGNEEWGFSYSATQWTLSGDGQDEFGNDWVYQGIIKYDSDGMLTSIEETYTLSSGDNVALKQYTWMQTGITPGEICSSGGSSGGSESDSAALGLGGPGSFIYLGLIVTIGVVMIYWQRKHE